VLPNVCQRRGIMRVYVHRRFHYSKAAVTCSLYLSHMRARNNLFYCFLSGLPSKIITTKLRRARVDGKFFMNRAVCAREDPPEEHKMNSQSNKELIICSECARLLT
jgi:hypothetical protein